jgi:hypothetical protein
MRVYRIALLLVVSVLSYTAKADCSHAEDFTSLPVPDGNGWSVSKLINGETSNGWIYANVLPIQGGSSVTPPNYKVIGASSANRAADLDGHTTSQGMLTSPVFNDGLSAISFSYTTGASKPILLEISIIQEDETVRRDTCSTSPANQNTVYTYLLEDINIDGSYQIVIKNLCPQEKSTGAALVDDVLVWNICLAAPIPPHNYQFNVPKDATVFVGDKDQTVTVAGNYLTKHYVPFAQKEEAYIAETDTSKIWYYDLPAPKNASGGFNYRVIRAGKAPHVGLFRPRAGTTVESDTLLAFTDEQLYARNAKDIDHDVNSLNGRNVADLFININGQGFLTLPLRADTAFQLIHTRNWQAIDSDVNNYFIEPDFHYTVVDENGQPSSAVIEISDSGVIRPVGAGTAIVLVGYDAMMCHHTTNVGISDVKTNPAFFSASWGENIAVFVVAVEQPEANITTNMNLNAYWAQDGTDKTEGVAIDAECDVMYFDADKGSFRYTFTPEGVTGVLVATPTVTETETAFSGFQTDSVTVNEDGSYTVRLGFGRNIVKLVSATGATYQVLTAKPVTWTVSNLTHPDEKFNAGDEVSVLFNTLYHPSNKMSGIYNMSAGIQYTGDNVNFPLILGPGQYTFASRAQGYKITIPEDYTGNEYVLTNGVINVRGFGSSFGAHRQITIQSGVAPNLNASVREAYFGALPDIHIPLESGNAIHHQVAQERISIYPNPFAEYLVIESATDGKATVCDLSGKPVLTLNVWAGSNRIDASALPKGIYLLKLGEITVKIVK